MKEKRRSPLAPDYRFNFSMKFAERAAQLLTCAFVFLLPWQTRLILYPGSLNDGAWEYGTISLYAVEIILWLAIAIATLDKLQVKSEKCKVAVKNLKFLGTVGSIGIIVLSVIRARAPELGWYWMLHAVEAAGIFWLLRRNFIRVKPLIVALLCGAVLQSALAFWQFSGQEVFASKWLGMATQDPAAAGVSVIENEQGRFLRAYGSLPHPNILGGYLAMALVILLGIRCQGSGIRIEKWFVALGAPFMVIGLILSFSRSAWLAFLLACLSFALFRKKFGSWKLEIGNLFYLLPFTFFILLLALWPLTQTRLLGEGRLERFSIEERTGKIGEAVEIIKKHPWVGVGLGNYTLAVHDELESARPGTAYQPVHNVFLLALAELGILGLAALGFLEVFLLKWWRFFKKPEALAIMAALLILMFFDHFLWSLPFGLWLSGLALGFASRAGDDTIVYTNQQIDSPNTTNNTNSYL